MLLGFGLGLGLPLLLGFFFLTWPKQETLGEVGSFVESKLGIPLLLLLLLVASIGMIGTLGALWGLGGGLRMAIEEVTLGRRSSSSIFGIFILTFEFAALSIGTFLSFGMCKFYEE